MRTIDEFKQDREQWNRETARKQRVRLLIGWTVAIVIIVVAASFGFKAFKANQANADTEKGKSADIQTPGAN
jgi:hypothetical protein